MLARPAHLRLDTVLAHSGRNPVEFGGTVNVPVVRASTVLYPNLAAYESSRGQKFGALRYGRYGTQTAFALVDALSELDGSDGAVLFPSGLAAIAGVLRTLLHPGDHLLMVDVVYAPTRRFAEDALKQDCIETTFFDPATNETIGDLIKTNTKVIYCESPGSHTFEIQDLPAIAQVCRQRGLVLVVDNTWATSYFFRPLQYGADIAIQSATKYIVGHSDAMLGVATAKSPHIESLRQSVAASGLIAAPDDCWLALRGLRTLSVRLRAHQEHADQVARWLTQHPKVRRVLWPALERDEYHALWKRDFAGASGVFGVELVDVGSEGIRRLVDRLMLFGIGSSWGGYESLVLPSAVVRTAVPPRTRGPTIRLQIGLEDPRDLIADLEQALDGMPIATGDRRDA